MTTVRSATPADLTSLVGLFERRDGVRYDEHAVARRLGGLDDSSARTEIAEVDGRVVAMSTVVLRELVAGRARWSAAYWTDLYVHDDYRKHGLYVPLARATLARAKTNGASVVLTANRRREVWAAHMKLGFRIAGAIPTRARPVRAMSSAIRIAGADRLARLVSPIDRAAFAMVDRVVERSGSGVDVVSGPVDDAATRALLPMLQRARGRSLGSELSLDAMRARYSTPLEGRPYSAFVARRDGDVVGGAIVRTARRGSFELGVVLDLVDGGDLDVGVGVVRAIERWAFDSGCDLVIGLDGAADVTPVWDAAGYPATPEWYVVLVAPAELASDATLGNAANWRFPFAEHDAF